MVRGRATAVGLVRPARWEGLCATEWKAVGFRRGARILARPDELGCQSRRMVVQVHMPRVEGVWRPAVHAGCVCNEWTGLTRRVLQPVEEFDPTTVPGLRRALRPLREKLRARLGGKLDRHAVVASYSGPKRDRYSEAAESLMSDELTWDDSRVTAFVKAEKAERPKEPRMIQFRSFRYTLELLRYLAPVSKAMGRVKSLRRMGVPPTLLFATHSSLRERAYVILEKFGHFSKGVVVELDMSRFDSHVSTGLLKVEQWFYRGLYPGDRYLAKILSWQLSNRGRSQGGIKYEVKGSRMSGDANTALGNNLLMFSMISWACKELRLRKWDYYGAGDDALLFIEEADRVRVLQALPGLMLRCGHRLTIDHVCRDPLDVTFCRSKVGVSADGYRMMRRPEAVLSGLTVSHRHFAEPKFGMRMLRTIAQGELILNLGVPVVQAYCAHLVGLLSSHRFADVSHDKRLQHHLGVEGRLGDWKTVCPLPVTYDARERFQEAFGWTIDEQLRVESEFRRLRLADIDLNRVRIISPHWLGYDGGYLDDAAVM